MRVVIYARVSTKDQSCDLQLRDLRTYCAARGFSLEREYVDVGESGAKDSRPQLNKLMAAARKRQIDAVLVWRFDRFARSTKHLLLALEEFRSLGIQFISYQENIDTSSPLGTRIGGGIAGAGAMGVETFGFGGVPGAIIGAHIGATAGAGGGVLFGGMAAAGCSAAGVYGH
jgi:DNA invertase Pin-like site-specific DNA recombinase